MKAVRIKCKTGESWSTSMNGNCSDEEICKYCLGATFNIGVVSDFMVICNEVEIDGRKY